MTDFDKSTEAENNHHSSGSAGFALLACPFCGEVPDYPSGDGTQYEIECDCGHASSSVQISDLMTIEERIADDFVDYRYGEQFIERAKIETTKMWNKRAPVGDYFPEDELAG